MASANSALSLSGPSLAPANGKPATAAVVLLHGYGSNGDDLIGLAPFFANHLPHAVFYSPNAPEPWEGGGFGGGRQWYGLGGYDPVAMQRDPSAMQARFNAMTGPRAVAGKLDRYLDEVLEAHQLAPERLALLGFSQGTMMSLYVGLRRTKSVGAILGFSGALTNADVLSADIKTKPPVCLIHGDADPVVPVRATMDAEKTLKSLGVDVESHIIPGLQHGIESSGATFGAAFLKKYLS